MKINIINEYYEEINPSRLFNKIAVNAKKYLDLKDNYVMSVILCNDEYIHDINASYRNIDKTTDVISFALLENDDLGILDNDEIELGDIFINIDACKRQAESYEHSFERELGFLFTHGLLHLNGYDHLNSEDEKIMISKQKEILDEILKR